MIKIKKHNILFKMLMFSLLVLLIWISISNALIVPGNVNGSLELTIKKNSINFIIQNNNYPKTFLDHKDVQNGATLGLDVIVVFYQNGKDTTKFFKFLYTYDLWEESFILQFQQDSTVIFRKKLKTKEDILKELEKIEILNFISVSQIDKNINSKFVCLFSFIDPKIKEKEQIKKLIENQKFLGADIHGENVGGPRIKSLFNAILENYNDKNSPNENLIWEHRIEFNIPPLSSKGVK